MQTFCADVDSITPPPTARVGVNRSSSSKAGPAFIVAPAEPPAPVVSDCDAFLAAAAAQTSATTLEPLDALRCSSPAASDDASSGSDSTNTPLDSYPAGMVSRLSAYSQDTRLSFCCRISV
jgi:hypothetical protein